MKLFIEQEIKYNEDAMPVRGLLRSKLCFGFKVGAYNFKKLMKYTFTGTLGKVVVIFTNKSFNSISKTVVFGC